MSDTVEDDESLRRTQMVAGIANKRADTALKEEQRRWEPWKALSAAFGRHCRGDGAFLVGRLGRVPPSLMKTR